MRRRCSGRSWSRWHRWQSALTLRCRRPQCAGSWSRCAAASTTLVVRLGCSSAAAGQGISRPLPSRQLCRASSHKRPSPRWRTTWPCGRPQASQQPLARTNRTQLTHLRPIDRVVVAQLGLDRHGGQLWASRAAVRTGGPHPGRIHQQILATAAVLATCVTSIHGTSTFWLPWPRRRRPTVRLAAVIGFQSRPPPCPGWASADSG